MDKLARRLREDADRIDVEVSDELDRRITASLHGVTQMAKPDSSAEQSRPAGFWWASSLTGIAAAAAVIVIVNLQRTVEPAPVTPANVVVAVPAIDWKAESAMLTGQLQEELDALQSDIKKAEKKVKDDIGL